MHCSLEKVRYRSVIARLFRFKIAVASSAMQDALLLRATRASSMRVLREQQMSVDSMS